MKITILLSLHWEAVRKIYEGGIATGNATFQNTAPTWEEWDTAHSLKPRLVAINNDTVWAGPPSHPLAEDVCMPAWAK